LGLDGDTAIAKTVSKAAEGYMRDDTRKVHSENKEIACMLVSGPTQEEKENEICQDMLLELEVLVVTYFSFHWKHAAAIVEKVPGLLFTRLSPLFWKLLIAVSPSTFCLHYNS